MSAIWTETIGDSSAWRGDDLARDRSWEQTLDNHHLAALDGALSNVRRHGLALTDIDRRSFPLPGLDRVLHRIAGELRTGRGFALLHGFPVNDYSPDDLEILYWGLCSHIGTGLTQNSDAGLIHYVTDGPLKPRQGKRGVGFPRKAPLHVDLMDIVSLLCVRQAPDDPLSWVASSMHVYNEILRQRPDMLVRLYDGFEWDRMDEHGLNESATTGYRVPVYSHVDGVVTCRYNRNWITSATERTARPLSPAEQEMFDFIDATAHANRLEFPFRVGDIQFCNNYTALHGRAAHEVVDDETRKRVLMRIWLDIPNVRRFTDEAVVRYGVGRHGALGWTAADLRAERHTRERTRRDDGAIAPG